MLRPLFPVLLLVFASLAGCFGGDDGDSPAPSTTDSPQPGAYEVRIRDHTTEGRAGQPVNVTWEVQAALDDENATNQSVLVSHTALHWGGQSVPDSGSDPQTNASTPATTSPALGVLAMQGNSTGNASSSYPNETRQQSGAAGPFNESFVVEEPGLVYLRAHAVIGNVSYWSDEIVVNVTEDASLPLGETHIVEIGATTPGPLSDYSPRALSIKVGDAVSWKNVDALSLGHTATSETGDPSFDTDTIAKDATSAPVFFNATGTWSYFCRIHPDTMTGASIVVA